jgi:hypothetical protein
VSSEGDTISEGIPNSITVKKTSDDVILKLVIIEAAPYSKTTKFLFDLYHKKNSRASITITILAIA